MMSVYGYKTKKDLKAAVGRRFQYVETSMFGTDFAPNGQNTVVGPSPYSRKWYATVHCVAGLIVKVT
jgi:hypothetical protein